MSTEPDTLRIIIPLSVRRRNGRPRIQPPAEYIPVNDGGTDPHVLRALAQAWSWRRKLESGEVATIEDMSRLANVTHRMVGRMLKLTYLAPKVLEKLLLERMPPRVSLRALIETADLNWTDQLRQNGQLYAFGPESSPSNCNR
ncbi:MAG: hypothetical protein RL339_664 [Pseudomonadota bacterium]|jgi:hypothetical protein